MTENKTTGSSKRDPLILGASIAALAATAYFLLGPNGEKHQEDAKDWALKMKGDVVAKLKAAKEVSKPIYDEIIDSVVAGYTGIKNIDQTEIKELGKDLKKHWETLVDPSKTKP